ARERQLDFQARTMRAQCLVNTTTDLQENVAEGMAVCESALILYQILERADWQEHPDCKHLDAAEQRCLAEDARELLLLLAWARVYLAPRTADPVLPQTVAAFLALLDPPHVPVHLPVSWPASQPVWGPRASPLRAS